MNRVTVESLISRISFAELPCGHTFTYRRKLYVKVVSDKNLHYALCLSDEPMNLCEFDKNSTVTRCRVEMMSTPISRLVNKTYKKRKTHA